VIMGSVKGTVEFLEQNNLVLTTAESCTAGLIASMLADISGCGSVFEFGYVVYSAAAKTQSLGVNQDTIDTYGLTSEAVAREMALGALQRSGADMAVANTGVAESDDELAGVICFAWAANLDTEPRVVSETVRFEGGRNKVRADAARYAIAQVSVYFQQLHQGS
jgi:nicotinamide-nucleotide amidase